MALMKCRECGHDVSTEAAACPNCGAPPPRVGATSAVAAKPASTRSPGQIAAGLVGLVVMVWILAKCISSSDESTPTRASAAPAPAPVAAVEPPPPPPPPRHNFNLEQDGEYGYEPAVSEADRQQGKKVNMMLMVRFNGEHNGQLRWSMVDNGVTNAFACSRPCEYVKGTTYLNGMPMGQETMRVAPGSILEAVVSDIDHGFLKVYGSQQHQQQ